MKEVELTEVTSLIETENLNKVKPLTNAPMSDNDLEKNFILKSLSNETRNSYRITLKLFKEFYNKRYGRDLIYADVNFSEVLEWRNWMLQNGKRENTVCAKLAGLRSLFEYGRALGIFKLNPASTKLVPIPEKPVHSPGRALTSKEVKSLLAWFSLSNLEGARNYAIILLMLRTSMRVSEVCKLKMSSIRWMSGRWVVTIKVKGGREEKRPLPNDVKKAIDNYLKLDRDERIKLKTNFDEAPLFQPINTRHRYFGETSPLTTRHIWHIVTTTANTCGIGHITPHDFRRTAITKAFKMNIPIHHIQRMSGHKDLNTLRRYDQDRENLEENAINFLDYNND